MKSDKIEAVKKISRRLIETCNMDYMRDIDIDLNGRLVILKGFRGVGKTTYLLQSLKSQGNPDSSIYLSLDHVFFAEHELFDTVDTLYDDGYRTFVFDEVHKYHSWSRELKNIYDSFPDIKVWATSSSALDIYKSEGDLSRRADVYEINGLSFREYLEYDYAITLPSFEFEYLLSNSMDIYESYFDEYNLGRKFNAYLKKGYYPYYKDAGKKYYDKLTTSLNQVIEMDLPAIFNIDYESTRQIKKLLSVISRIAPFQPNISKLSRDLKIPRNSIIRFIDILEQADVISVLKSGRKSDSAMAKPDKILLDNTNMLYALSSNSENTGTIRETFIVNVLSNKYKISTPAKGDILLEGKYSIEIGGKSKSFTQLHDMANPVLIKDGITVPSANVLPMWMLGML